MHVTTHRFYGAVVGGVEQRRWRRTMSHRWVCGAMRPVSRTTQHLVPVLFVGFRIIARVSEALPGIRQGHAQAGQALANARILFPAFSGNLPIFSGFSGVFGMLFRLFSALRRYSPLFSDRNVSSISCSRYFLYSGFHFRD